MKILYYKIVCGYGENREIPITSDELEKAYAVFLTPKARAIFTNGAVTHDEIRLIVPDVLRTLGWNSAHRINADDHTDPDFMRAERALNQFQGRARGRVSYLLERGRASEIGKGVPIPELEPVTSPQVKALADKLRV